jgi:hypothetical protein
MGLGMSTNINQLLTKSPNSESLELNFGNLIFKGLLVIYVELTILGFINFLSFHAMIIVAFLNLIGIIYFFYLSVYQRIHFKYNNKKVFALLLILSLLVVPNSLSVPLGWDSLAFHLNLPRFYFNNSFYDLDHNVTHLGYFLGSDVLNLIPVLLEDYRLSSFINIIVMSIILNTLFILGKLIKSVSISILVILFFISDTTFLKAPITSFNIDYFLILIGLNLIHFVLMSKNPYSLSRMFYFGTLIFAFSFAKIYSFALIVIWVMLYVIVAIKRKIRIRIDILIPSIIGLIPAAAWLTRNTLFYKNPFYPYFDQLFHRDNLAGNWSDPFGPLSNERFRFFGIMNRFDWSLNSYTLIYEFILVILTVLFSFYLIKKYWTNCLVLPFIASSLIIYVYLYWSTGDELTRYRHFILWMIIYLLLFTLKKERLRGFIFAFMFLFAMINFSVSRHVFIQNLGHNLTKNNSSDQLSELQSYDQFKLIRLANTKYKKEKVLLLGDNRLALLPINFRAADPSRFSVVSSKSYNTTEKIIDYLKQNNIKIVILSLDWGEPAKWNKELWLGLFENQQRCETYSYEGLRVCEITS